MILFPPTLFTLCLDVISKNILRDETIKGITIQNTELKLIQYADDTTAVLKDKNSLQAFLAHLRNYTYLSGLRINHAKSKSEAIRLGNIAPNFNLPNGMKWSTKPVKILGVYMHGDLNMANNLTISSKIQSMRKLIYSWQHRKLTLIGRVQIVKSLIIPQITHILNTIPVTNIQLKEIEELIYQYIWQGKTNKVKSSVIVQDYVYGGLKVPDIKALTESQKLKWVKLYTENHPCLWKVLTDSLINVKNLHIYLRSNFHLQPNVTQSLFYQDVLTSLSHLNKLDNGNDCSNLMNQFVYYNKNVMSSGTMFYDEQLLHAGLWKISDLYDPQGRLLPFNVWRNRGVCQSKFMTWRQDCQYCTILGRRYTL